MGSEIPQHEIQEIIELLETRHRVRLPVEIRYSKNIGSSFCIMAMDSIKWKRMSPDEKSRFCRSRDGALRLKGLADSESESIGVSKFTVFLSTRHGSLADMYAAVWEELGHAVAWVLFVRDQELNGSIAVAYRFWGLLKAAVDNRVSLKEAIDQIETYVKTLEHPLSILSEHRGSLDAIRAFNPDLKFQGRDPEELLNELSESIDYAFRLDIRRKLRFEKPLIIGLMFIMLILLIISVVL